MEKAVVLLSGGVDSATTMAIAKSEGYELYALSIDYGQRHVVELERASQVAAYFNAREHRIVSVDLREIGGSALTSDIKVPKDRTAENMVKEIPVTYVPARNTIFLAIALAWAEVIGAETIFLGVNVLDYSGYPDCRPEFIEAFQSLANLATKMAVEGSPITIQAPLQHLSKMQTICLGLELGVDYSLTVSCYQADETGRACGACPSCELRQRGFKQAKLSDPTHYF